MIKIGDKVILDGVEYFVNDIKSGSVSLYKEKNPLNVMFMNEKTLYVKLYEQQKQRADELELQLKETTNVAIDRLEIISNFKTFICESIDNAKEDCKKDDSKSNRLWLKALQYVYTYGIKKFKENDE